MPPPPGSLLQDGLWEGGGLCWVPSWGAGPPPCPGRRLGRERGSPQPIGGGGTRILHPPSRAPGPCPRRRGDRRAALRVPCPLFSFIVTGWGRSRLCTHTHARVHAHRLKPASWKSGRIRPFGVRLPKNRGIRAGEGKGQRGASPTACRAWVAGRRGQGSACGQNAA